VYLSFFPRTFNKCSCPFPTKATISFCPQLFSTKCRFPPTATFSNEGNKVFTPFQLRKPFPSLLSPHNRSQIHFNLPEKNGSTKTAVSWVFAITKSFLRYTQRSCKAKNTPKKYAFFGTRFFVLMYRFRNPFSILSKGDQGDNAKSNGAQF